MPSITGNGPKHSRVDRVAYPLDPFGGVETSRESGEKFQVRKRGGIEKLDGLDALFVKLLDTRSGEVRS